MIIVVVLALFLLIFFCLRKNSGAAILAAIAGVALYGLFGEGFAAQIHGWMPGWEQWVIEKAIYLVFVLGFPMLIYFRSTRGGLHGILRLVEAALFALILTALISDPLAAFFEFDSLSSDISYWIKSIQGYVVVAGAIGAYLDILLCKSSD